MGGQAFILCEVEPDTTLSRCAVGDPIDGYGFGAAALSLAASFRVRPETIDGDPVVRGRVGAPIRFEPLEGATPPKAIWIASPTQVDVRAAMPRPRGRPATSGGVGVMRCTVAGGLLSDCRPSGDRTDPFGRAAVKLAAKFSIHRIFPNGRATDGTIIDIPVVFDGPGEKPPAPALANPVTFLKAPTNAQKNAVFPAAARDHGVTTLAVSETCVLGPDGGLTRCKATKEEPVGVGGAEAATRLVNAFQLPTWSEGRPLAGAPVTVDIVWAPPTAVPKPAGLAPAAAPSAPPAKPARRRR